jgi:hypothetical protein
MIRSILSLISSRSLRRQVDLVIGAAVAFGGHHFLVLGVVVLVQLVQVLILVDQGLELVGANVQVCRQIMRNWHFFTSFRVGERA